MKIVYLVKHYDQLGGKERVVFLKMNYLAELDNTQVYLISSKEPAHDPYFYINPKIQIIHLGISERDKSKQNISKYLEKLDGILKDIKPDICISTGIELSINIPLLRDGSSKIFEIHGPKYKRRAFLANWDKYLILRIFGYIYSYSYSQKIKKFDRFITLTDEDKEYWRGFTNIEVIPNPISLNPHSVSDCDSKKVIALGRFVTQKAFDLLIAIWKEIRITHPDWKLMLYGGGKKEHKLNKLISKLNLEDVVELLPATDRVEENLIGSSVYAMTSRYEGLPMVLLEAMSCGLPIISYACKCGPRDLIENGKNGFLVDFGDSKQFVKDLRILLDDQNLRLQMGKEGKIKAMNYTMDIIMSKWLNLFSKLIEEKNVKSDML